MILLHGFVKKTQKTPSRELDIAVARMKDFVKAIKERPGYAKGREL